VFVAFLQSTIMDVLIGPLVDEFQASRADLEWTVNAFALAMAAVLVGAGAWTDRIGARRVFGFGMGCFTAAAAGVALAPDLGTLTAALLVAGACAGLVMPSSMILMTASARDHAGRARNIGWWAASTSLAMVAGPLLAGWFAAGPGGWRMVFWVQAAAGAAAATAGLRFLPRTPSRARDLDIWGQLALGAAFSGLVYALVEAADHGLAGPVWWGVAVCGAGAVAAFLAERRARTPVLPRAMVTNRSYLAVLAQGLAFNFALFGLVFVLGVLLQRGRGFSVGQSALVLSALTGSIMAGNLLAAFAGRPARSRRRLAATQAALAAALALTGWAAATGSTSALVLALAPTGLAAGILVPTMTTRVLAAVPLELHGTASAVFNTVRSVGSAVGVAVFGLLLGNAPGAGLAPESLTAGFVRCAVAGCLAMVIALALNWATAKET
jgi:DHA2 family methylenomycin A resistance protein-like MFS transporter